MEAAAINDNRVIYYRLIALWAVCEAVLGGIIHGLRLPVSGLVVGSSALLCISLIAWYVPERGAILKAMLVVAMVKMMISPHSPLPAYVALGFQGLMGTLLFRDSRFYSISCWLLCIICLAESAVQRVLVMTVIYGGDLWKLTDEWMAGITGREAAYSSWMIGGYLALHVIAGCIVGALAAKLPRKIERWKEGVLPMDMTAPVSVDQQRRKSVGLLIVISLFLLGMLAVTYFIIPGQNVFNNRILILVIRSLLLMSIWYWVISPILTRWLHRWLRRQQGRHGTELAAVLQLLPRTRMVVARSWQLSQAASGPKRIRLFFKTAIVHTLTHD